MPPVQWGSRTRRQAGMSSAHDLLQAGFHSRTMEGRGKECSQQGTHKRIPSTAFLPAILICPLQTCMLLRALRAALMKFKIAHIQQRKHGKCDSQSGHTSGIVSEPSATGEAPATQCYIHTNLARQENKQAQPPQSTIQPPINRGRGNVHLWRTRTLWAAACASTHGTPHLLG